ncbi:unnamed protein product [Thelazia callipaeda]|uniref:Uncharacterized protein n=1 Tax=Thelazia callipaeda TaxID=103827 RepID=A0A0N5DB17_THECL|nr:unnamed protein product [Thelazia callipaeda]
MHCDYSAAYCRKVQQLPILINKTSNCAEVAMHLAVPELNKCSSTEEPLFVEISQQASTSITSNFTAAAIASAQPRHKRYAAHIPVNRVEATERHSADSSTR